MIEMMLTWGDVEPSQHSTLLVRAMDGGDDKWIRFAGYFDTMREWGARFSSADDPKCVSLFFGDLTQGTTRSMGVLASTISGVRNQDFIWTLSNDDGVVLTGHHRQSDLRRGLH
jgi:hypothetical protein